MDRFLACSLVIVLGACSDDGAPAAGTEGGSASVSAGTGDAEGSSNGDPTPGTSADPSASESDSAGPESGGGTTAGPSNATTCEQDEDCMLLNDCCYCLATHVEDAPPPCEMQECFAPTCDANGLPNLEVRCRFGTCEFVPFSCSPFLVACDELPPECTASQLPSVVDGCWGPCVPAELCDAVPSCDTCLEGEVCIESSTQLGYTFTCEPIDPSCPGVPDCTCMGTACEDPFVCAPASDANGADLACECPTC
jgi:hypothetical protein